MLEQVLIAKVYQLSRNLCRSSPRLSTIASAARNALLCRARWCRASPRRRGFERRHGAGAIARVALLHIRENCRVIDLLAASASSSARRCARVSGEAVTKIFTRASGRSPCRCRARRAPRPLRARRNGVADRPASARTCGSAATTEAASPISRARRRASSKSVSDRPRAAAVGGPRRRAAGPRRAARRRWRDRAGRCRDAAGRNARRGGAPACPCPTPPARRWR